MQDVNKLNTLLGQDDYLTEKQLAELWGIKRNTIQKWRTNGTGPEFIKRVGHIVYRKDAIAEFEKNQTYQSTYAYRAGRM
ncbi:MAG: helix-turn-helix domain-containing protein [Rickettsiales bacterium]|jgi:predicted site-specific integrase-resolvase|nr:helix-turn-helix domain-containing protein [Rickettsiales bacterium]